MQWIFPTVLISTLLLQCFCQQCPSVYLRYSKQHSFCKPRNAACPVFHSGVTSGERRQVVDLHNRYRSLVATGRERKAGGMPEAADMMQMVWDSELAAVAQRRAEQCLYEHDCNDCRRVENFPVGQNIAYREMLCSGARKCPLNAVPDWTAVIKMFYDEVAEFDKKYIKSMVFVPGKEYGHFTQMVWSKTWRIGCGFVAFEKGNGYRQFYVCNYGPGGNVMNTPMYESGPPCSSCPLNSCCGKSCKGADYPGLCRMNRNDEAPVYRLEGNFIFYCDFRNPAGDCSNYVEGPNKWKFVKALGGSFAEIVLNGGEKSTLKLKKPILPKENFCLLVVYRSGPALDGQKPSNKASVTLEMPNSRPTNLNLPKIRGKQFFRYSINLGWSDDTSVSFTFSVPRGDPAQFFNIQLVTARNGKC